VIVQGAQEAAQAGYAEEAEIGSNRPIGTTSLSVRRNSPGNSPKESVFICPHCGNFVSIEIDEVETRRSPSGAVFKPWSAEETERLRQLVLQKVPFRKVRASFPDRTEESVRKKRKVMRRRMRAAGQI